MADSRYDAHTALIVTDVQNDFTDPAGNLYVAGGEALVPTMNTEIERARAADALVVYSLDYHPPDTPHFEKDGGVWPVHCVAGSWGSALHPDLRRVEGPHVHKGTGGEDGYSAFSLRDPESGAQDVTELDAILREHGITRVVVIGLALDYCVKETVLDARRFGYDVTLLHDATAPVNLAPDDGARALRMIEAAGAEVAAA